MAMAVGGKTHQKSEINMTPMIDVLLVLIIIFMVITPLAPTGLKALLPQPPPPDQDPKPRLMDIVLTVGRDQTVLLNGEPIATGNLRKRLTHIYETRGDTVIFVR